MYRAGKSADHQGAPVPLADGLGLDAEPPLIRVGRGSDSTVEEGMVVAVESWVVSDEVESAGSSALAHNRSL